MCRWKEKKTEILKRLFSVVHFLVIYTLFSLVTYVRTSTVITYGDLALNSTLLEQNKCGLYTC